MNTKGQEHYYTIHWSNFSNDSYLYGSQIAFLDGGRVVFKNDLMPSGAVINEWSSIVAYNDRRRTLNLPLLSAEKSYQLTIDLEVTPRRTVYVALVFYSRYDTIIDTLVTKDKQLDFTLPKECYYYKIQLINSGHESLTFHRFIIREQAEDASQSETKLALPVVKSGSSDLTILFSDEQPATIGSILADGRFKQLNYLVIDHQDQAFLSEERQDEIHDVIIRHQYKKGRQMVNFVGYSPLTNLVALYYARVFEQSNAYLTSLDGLDKLELPGLSATDQNALLAWAKESFRIDLYGDQFGADVDPLILPIVKKANVLYRLPFLDN